MDKASATLTQKDTHFYDRTTAYDLMASHRTAAFLSQQNHFLCCPFADLSPAAQAFILGYLCHLCLDEVSKHIWRREVWIQLKRVHPGATFAAIDEAARQRIQNFPAIAKSFCSVEVQDVIPRIPLADLERMLQGTCQFVQAPSIEEAFMALVDLFDQPTPEERQKKRQYLRRGLGLARQQAHFFTIDRVVDAAVAHSRQRLTDLIEGCIPEPGYPTI